jgi:hypothetical protein
MTLQDFFTWKCGVMVLSSCILTTQLVLRLVVRGLDSSSLLERARKERLGLEVGLSSHEQKV